MVTLQILELTVVKVQYLLVVVQVVGAGASAGGERRECERGRQESAAHANAGCYSVIGRRTMVDAASMRAARGAIMAGGRCEWIK
jgi:hypothetical protein